MSARGDPKLRALEVCLRGMQAGRDPEELLDSYPKWASELRPLLQAGRLAVQLGAAPSVPHLAQEHSRSDFLQMAQRMLPRPPRLWLAALARFGLALLVLLVVLSLAGWGAWRLSASSLPGDWLYPLKRFGEQTRLWLADSSRQRFELELSFDQQRLAEVQSLVQRQRPAEVDFSGGLSQLQATECTVGGLKVSIPPDARLVGGIQQGYYVNVQAELQVDGSLWARQLQARQYLIEGQVESIAPDRLVVAGLELALTPETAFIGSPAPLDRVLVQALLTLDQRLQARLIEVLAPD